MSHEHSIIDTDKHFVINPANRSITKGPSTKTLELIQNDHNSERFTFEMSRTIEGHDMLKCDKVEVHYINIGSTYRGSTNKLEFRGVYEVDDLQLDAKSDNTIVFSWLVSQNATQAAGNLSFIVRFLCLNGEEIEYAWHTGVFSDITVGTGIDNGSYVASAYPDVLEAWKNEIESSVNADIRSDIMDDVTKQITEVANDAISKIEATEQTLTIDISELDSRIDNIVANATTTEGNSELIDVRLGADGTTYKSAGEAVRSGHRKNHGALNATAYLSYDGTFDWDFDIPSAIFTLSFSGRIAVLVPGYTEAAFTTDASWETLGANIADHISIGEDGLAATVTMGSYCCLLLNTATGLLEIRAAHNVPETGVVLVRTSYQGVVGGLLEEYRLSKRIENVATDYAYVYNDSSIYLEKVSTNGSMIVTVNDDGLVVSGHNYPFADCCDNLGDKASIGSKKTVITIPPHNSLTLNRRTGLYELVANVDIKSQHIILVRNGWSNYSGGLLDPALNWWNVDKFDQTLLKTTVVNSYTGSNARIKVTPNMTNGDLKIRFEGDHLGLRTFDTYYSVTISESLDYVSSVMDDDGVGCTISIGAYKILAYRTTIGKFLSLTNEGVTLNDIPLLYNGWANFSGGPLMPYVLKQDIAELDTKLTSRIDAIEPQATVASTELEAYAQAVADSDADAFLFFTDPHTGSWAGWEKNTDKLIDYVGDIYNRLPMDFCLCGGDWLNNSDTMSEACSMLGYFEGRMRSTFHNYHHLVGNHDYNYQLWDEESQLIITNPDILTPTQMAGLWRNENRKTYYTFKDGVTRFVVFDTGLDSIGIDATVNANVNAQIAWFDEVLKNNTDTYLALALHIITNGGSIYYIADKIFKMANAFNNRTTVTIDGVTYDYSNATGTVKFAIGGHTHYDASGTHEGIPYLITTRAYLDNIPTFDLISVDYASGKLKAFRIGTGEDRELSI